MGQSSERRQPSRDATRAPHRRCSSRWVVRLGEQLDAEEGGRVAVPRHEVPELVPVQPASLRVGEELAHGGAGPAVARVVRVVVPVRVRGGDPEVGEHLQTRHEVDTALLYGFEEAVQTAQKEQVVAPGRLARRLKEEHGIVAGEEPEVVQAMPLIPSEFVVELSQAARHPETLADRHEGLPRLKHGSCGGAARRADEPRAR